MDRQKLLAVIAAVALVAIAAVVYYENRKSHAPEEASGPPVTARQPPEPAIRNPVPEVPAETPATGPQRERLRRSAIRCRRVVGRDAVSQFLAPNDVIRRMVVTVDNLPRKKVAVERRPILPTGGTFATSGSDESLTLSPNNYARYAPLVRLVEAADANQLAALYFRYYPLFQRAYEDLGYPKGVFQRSAGGSDRRRARDAARQRARSNWCSRACSTSLPTRRSSLRSAGQKLLMRMGTENAAAFKAKLTEVRNIIVTQKPAAGT